MHDQRTRAAILRLHEAGHSNRKIAKALGISRGAVADILELATEEVPAIVRREKMAPFHDEVLSLFVDCKGNLVRVHEELLHRMQDKDPTASLSYQALTAYCRRHGIGHEPPVPAGRYDFGPGKEMQHDTSPHEPHVGGKVREAQTSSLVFCFSRMTFFQFYPRFTRLECKIFLTDAAMYFDGVCEICMVDNTHVIVLHGTGASMVPVPEMAAFGERLGFEFRAHEVGDANRSARVEGPFNQIEKNFLAGRKFEDWDDLNRQAVAWCDKLNAKFSKNLRASRQQLFAQERPHIKPLPIWIPEVYDLHHRIIDLEGYIHVRGCHYSAPYTLIGRQLEIRETKSEIQLFDGPRQIAVHRRLTEPGARSTLPEHRPPRRKPMAPGPLPEEHEILAAVPDLATYVAELKKRCVGRGTIPLRRLLRLLREYPRDAFLSALQEATHYGLYDLERVERMILRSVDRVFFPQLIADLALTDPDDQETIDE
jgi:transposase